MRDWRLPAWILLGFAGAGMAGVWPLIPSPLFYVATILLPGHVAASVLRLDRQPYASGPARPLLDVCLSLSLLAPPLLGLAAMDRPLSDASITLGLSYAALAAPAFLVRPVVPYQDRVCGRWYRNEWLWVVLASAVLLPLVWAYAGGTVDDWWDLAFVRAYADRGAFSLSEPVLGSGRVHPRFAWNPWLVAQALALALCGGDPAVLQARVVAPLVCVLVVCAFALLARMFLSEHGWRTRFLAVLMIPVWLCGTEAFPFFTRLHQDKFVAGLVLVPAMVAWAGGCVVERTNTTSPLLFAAAALACASVHGLMFAIGLIGAGIVVVSAMGTSAVRDGRVITLGVIASAVALYPAWQALEVGRWFAAEGISLAAADNPVVRAHLALGRLWMPQSPAYVVRPSAVFGPVALFALPALRCLWRGRKQAVERALLALAVVPCVLVFVPFVAAAVGWLLVPWMLYRVAWLVPVPLLLSVTVAGCARGSTRWRSVLAGVAALAVLFVSARTGVARLRRDMQPHPVERERAPSGSTLRLYEALSRRPEAGSVLAPPGLAHLLPAMSGRPVVASTERATLVFSGDEVDAYRRLADRARFYSRTTTATERERIVRRYGVRLVVFRRRLIVRGSETDWLATSSPEALADWVDHGGMETPFARRDLLDHLIPETWSVVWENADFFLVVTDAGEAPDPPAAAERGLPWTAAFPVTGFDERPEGEPLASAVAYPGAIYDFEPVPATLATPHGIAWTAGGRLWHDGPAEVQLRVHLEQPCPVTGIEIVPSIRTGRREVLAVTAGGRTRRGVAHDGEPVFVALDGAPADHLTIDVGSLLGVPFALEDVRVWGRRSLCRGDWSPRARPLWPAAQLGVARLLDLVQDYPRQAKTAVALARRLEEGRRPRDAREVLRLALARQQNRPVPWIEVGLLEDAAGQPDAALAAYRRALAVDSNNVWARGCLAWALLRRGRVLSGMWQAWRARKAEPRYADAYTIEALGAERMGLDGLAERRLRRAVELDPRRGWGTIELARLLDRLGRRAEAAEVIGAYLERVPDDAPARAFAERLGAPPARGGGDDAP